MLNFFLLILRTFFYILSEFQINLPQATSWTHILKSMWETMESSSALGGPRETHWERDSHALNESKGSMVLKH